MSITFQKICHVPVDFGKFVASSVKQTVLELPHTMVQTFSNTKGMNKCFKVIAEGADLYTKFLATHVPVLLLKAYLKPFVELTSALFLLTKLRRISVWWNSPDKARKVREVLGLGCKLCTSLKYLDARELVDLARWSMNLSKFPVFKTVLSYPFITLSLFKNLLKIGGTLAAAFSHWSKLRKLDAEGVKCAAKILNWDNEVALIMRAVDYFTSMNNEELITDSSIDAGLEARNTLEAIVESKLTQNEAKLTRLQLELRLAQRGLNPEVATRTQTQLLTQQEIDALDQQIATLRIQMGRYNWAKADEQEIKQQMAEQAKLLRRALRMIRRAENGAFPSSDVAGEKLDAKALLQLKNYCLDLQQMLDEQQTILEHQSQAWQQIVLNRTATLQSNIQTRTDTFQLQIQNISRRVDRLNVYKKGIADGNADILEAMKAECEYRAAKWTAKHQNNLRLRRISVWALRDNLSQAGKSVIKVMAIFLGFTTNGSFYLIVKFVIKSIGWKRFCVKESDKYVIPLPPRPKFNLSPQASKRKK